MPRAAAQQKPGPNIEYKKWLGISNAKDRTRIPNNYLRRAMNVDVDVENMIHMRRGRKMFIPFGATSLWANGDETYCFFVGIDGNLYMMNPDMSYTNILSGVGMSEMEFIDVNGIIYFTNNNIVGYIQNGVPHAFPAIDKSVLANTFKETMVGGTCLEYWNSRLYVAQDDIIFFSDAGKPMVRDSRHNFIQEIGKITMIKSVVDGLYVSAGQHVFFYKARASRWAGELKGEVPQFQRIPIIDVPAYKGMAIKIEGEKISPKVEGVVVIWPGDEGVFMGMPGGNFERLTGRNLFLGGVARGRGVFFVRLLHPFSPGAGGFEPGYPQYFCVYDYLPGYGGGSINLNLPKLSINLLGTTALIQPYTQAPSYYVPPCQGGAQSSTGAPSGSQNSFST